MKTRRPKSGSSFRKMAVRFRLRERRHPPVGILRAAGLCAGMTVVDFGCGPGGFSLAAARLVGAEGRVYALDRNPLAVEYVRRGATRRGLRNVHGVGGDYMAAMPRTSVDFILLYDVLHDLEKPGEVLAEFHRVLKGEGRLSVSDHHLEEEVILQAITGGGIFRLASCNRRSYEFEPPPGVSG